MNRQADYAEFDAVVGENRAAMGASECHGALSGMLCVNRRLLLQEWLAEVWGGEKADLSGGELALFDSLFQQTRQDLETFDFDFDLLLPNDEMPLTERAAALSGWCRGFLYGLGSLVEGAVCGEEGKEVLQDIYQIADLETGDLFDDDEDAYAELVEYLRVGVQLLRSEFQAPVDSKRLH